MIINAAQTRESRNNISCAVTKSKIFIAKFFKVSFYLQMLYCRHMSTENAFGTKMRVNRDILI